MSSLASANRRTLQREPRGNYWMGRYDDLKNRGTQQSVLPEGLQNFGTGASEGFQKATEGIQRLPGDMQKARHGFSTTPQTLASRSLQRVGGREKTKSQFAAGPTRRSSLSTRADTAG